MLFKKLYLLITLTTFCLIFINDDVLNKNNTMAQSKTSSIYVNVKGENNNYLSFKNIPKLSFECAKPNCKCLKQFDINYIDEEYFNDKISIEDSRDEKENNGYNLSLTLGDFFHLDNNGQIQEKVDSIKNSFSLTMGDLKLKKISSEI